MSATPVMDDDTLFPFELPAVAGKKVSVAFDGGMLSSDCEVLLLRGVERQLGMAARRHAQPIAAILTASPTRWKRCFEPKNLGERPALLASGLEHAVGTQWARNQT